MTFYYQDTDAGSDASDGTTWANAKLTFEGLLAVMAAGDTGYVQGLTTDTAAASRTLASSGTITNICKIIGVVDGTTNTGASVVTSDLAVTLPVVEVTGAGNDITITGAVSFSNIKIITADRLTTSSLITFDNSTLELGGRLATGSTGGFITHNTTIEWTGSAGEVFGRIDMYGGSIIFTSSSIIAASTIGTPMSFYGVDLSTGTTGLSAIQKGNGAGAEILVSNCKMPATWSLSASALDTVASKITAISSSNTTSQAATSSIQDYQHEDAFGSIDLETTAVRTGGADDGATGAFSYAMTPTASGVLEGSGANLVSPMMAVWLSGGTNTLTIYIASDATTTDYNEDEVWVEFYTPDSGDTAQHDQAFDPADARLLDSTTAITDDAVSTWGTGASNGQKLSITVTTGFEGYAYARLHLAKREATPTTLFLDPKIEVS